MSMKLFPEKAIKTPEKWLKTNDTKTTEKKGPKCEKQMAKTSKML